MSILSKIYYTKLLSYLRRKKETKQTDQRKSFCIFIDNEDLLEKTEISSNTTNAISTSDYDKEIVTAGGFE